MNNSMEDLNSNSPPETELRANTSSQTVLNNPNNNNEEQQILRTEGSSFSMSSTPLLDSRCPMVWFPPQNFEEEARRIAGLPIFEDPPTRCNFSYYLDALSSYNSTQIETTTISSTSSKKSLRKKPTPASSSQGCTSTETFTEVEKLERKRAMCIAEPQRRNNRLKKERLTQLPTEEQEMERRREYSRVKARLREEKCRKKMTEEDLERRKAKWRAQHLKKEERFQKRTEEEQRLAEEKKRAAAAQMSLKKMEKKREGWRAQYARRKEKRMNDPVFAAKCKAQWRASNKRRMDRMKNKSKQIKSRSSSSSKSTPRARATANNNQGRKTTSPEKTTQSKSKVVSTSSSPSSSASPPKRTKEPQPTKSRRAGSRKSSCKADKPSPKLPLCSVQLTKLDETSSSVAVSDQIQ